MLKMLFGRENLVLQRSFDFSLRVIKLSEELEKNGKYVVARQILKSATSIGASLMEAQDAESNADFVHKLKIAIKEANETFYWLLLCEKTDTYPSDPELSSELLEIRKIINRIIITSKKKIKES